MGKELEEPDEIATDILLYLYEKQIEPNTAQAALGSAWVRLCRGMQFDKSLFQEMCEGMVSLYEK